MADGGRRLCLVTGASAGIGAALARIYARNGWDLALTARRQDRLSDLAAELEREHGATCLIIEADLFDPGAPEAILAEIAAAGREVDGLVNNAGYGGAENFAAADWAEHADFIQVMMTAPIHLTHLALPGMMARGYGRVINVASVAGMIPPAHRQTLYGAAKAFLIHASRALRMQAAGTGVHVTALCPGLTHTEFHALAGLEHLTAGTPGFAWQSAETVAQVAYKASEKDRAVVVSGTANKLAAALFKILPDDLGQALMMRAAKRWETE